VGGDGALLERDHELGVLDGLLGSALAGGPAFVLIEGPPEGRGRWLKGPAAGATRVFEPPSEEHAAGDVSFGVLHGLFWLTANIAAEGPLLLAVDDLHWCDPLANSMSRYLIERITSMPNIGAMSIYHVHRYLGTI
jgi:hypothetical protein